MASWHQNRLGVVEGSEYSEDLFGYEYHDDAKGGEEEALYLNCLVFDFEEGMALSEPVRDILQRWIDGRKEASGGLSVLDYFRTCWPNGSSMTLYAANIGREPNHSQHLDLLLRPVLGGPQGQLPAVGDYVLSMHVQRSQGKLKVKRVEVAPHVPLRSFERRICAQIVWNDPSRYIEPWEIEKLRQNLPYHRANTKARMDDWYAYLEWKKQIVEANQIRIAYQAYRWVDDTLLELLVRESELPEKRIVGEEIAVVDGEEDGSERRKTPRTRDVGEIEALVDSNKRRSQREPHRKAGGEVIEQGETDGDENESEEANKRWNRLRSQSGMRVLRVRVEEDRSLVLQKEGLPSRGELISSIAGEMAQINQQKGGLDRLQRNQGFSDYLPDFIFDAGGARIDHRYTEPLPLMKGGRGLNDGQQEAIRKASASPDLCLIQGPPGTGKTTVIAEICLRAALEKKRVLLASQTNLAVDNALSRLVGNPAVRALRLGREERVDEEFQEFLAKYVIHRWFQTIAEHCLERVDAFERQQQALEGKISFAHKAKSLYQNYQDCQNKIQKLRVKESENENSYEEVKEKTQKIRKEQEGREQKRRVYEALLALGEDDNAGLPDGWETIWEDGLVVLPFGMGKVERPLSVLWENLRQGSDIVEMRKVLDSLLEEETMMSQEDGAEMSRLMEQKKRLMESTDEEEAKKLADVNRQIKKRKENGWFRQTGRLKLIAERIWGKKLPESVSLLVDELQPSKKTDEAVRQVLELVKKREAQQSDVLIVWRELCVLWKTRLGVTQQEAQQSKQAILDGEDKEKQAKDVLETIRKERKTQEENLRSYERNWHSLFSEQQCAIKSKIPSEEGIQAAVEQLAAYQSEHGEKIKRAEKWSIIQQEWSARLANIEHADKEKLESLYVEQANVVGLTCHEAGRKSFWNAPSFKAFDIVIVDEVSKATPPELILPLLLGRKAILVGDHRQLPPTFREKKSYEEAEQEGLVVKEDVKRFQKMVTAGLFEELFRGAHEANKATLWMQYRMHPQIMGAVNLFYEGRLQAGPSEQVLSEKRRHPLEIKDAVGGELLSSGKHLVWVDSSMDSNGKPFWEQQVGSSKQNEHEVELIIRFLMRLGRCYRSWGFRSERRERLLEKQDQGKKLSEIVREMLPDAPLFVIEDLFDERRVRVGKRVQQKDAEAQKGTLLEIDARKEVGVITFYGVQLRALRREIAQERESNRGDLLALELRTNTVDRFQGMEKPIVLVSLVRSTKGNMGGFVKEFQRINVGFSRAQQLLVVFGAVDTWKKAKVPLPSLEYEAGRVDPEVEIYREIIEKARLMGGFRDAKQFFGS